jgi:hypothetical protein
MDEKMNFPCEHHGWKGFCDAGIYQKTVIRVQKTMHSKVSLEYASCVRCPFYDVRVG